MMELWNSLGCKMCKKPLERCEAVNKTNTRRPGRVDRNNPNQHQLPAVKFEGTFRQQLLQGAKAEELDPVPVAARCGHMFHRGCIKKMTTELNSSCIECPICTKPVTLTNVWQIEFYHPEKADTSNRPRTIPAKVHSMNEKNDALQEELIEVRRLRTHKEAEYREVVDTVNNIKQLVLNRRKELDDKLIQIFGAPSLDERYEENVRLEKEAILLRVKELTNRNSQLLARIEERAKTHYIHEGENVKDDPCIRNLETKIRENREKHQKKRQEEVNAASQRQLKNQLFNNNNNEMSELGDFLKADFPAKMSQNESKANSLISNAKGDAYRTIPNFDRKSSSKSSHNNHHLLDDLKGSQNQDSSSILTAFLKKSSKNSKNINSINNNSGGSCVDGNSSNTCTNTREYPIPMATVTKSMQELFQEEKLKYLLAKSKEKETMNKDKERGRNPVDHHSHNHNHHHSHHHNEHGQTKVNNSNCNNDKGDNEDESSENDSESDSDSGDDSHGGAAHKMVIGAGADNSNNNSELMLSKGGRKGAIIPPGLNELLIARRDKDKQQQQRSGGAESPDIAEKTSKSYFQKATAAIISPNHNHHHPHRPHPQNLHSNQSQSHRLHTPTGKTVVTKTLKFKPSKTSVKGKVSGRLKSNPPSQYKLADPQGVKPMKTHDFTKYVLNMTQQKKQRWKRSPTKLNPKIEDMNLTGKPFYGHHHI